VPLQLIARTGHPDFLDLPWHLPLERWQSERLVELPRGISRHVVRFVNYDGAIYALKELPSRFAQREYSLLRRLADESIPVVEAVGVISSRGPDLDSVLITRHLVYSLPYRALFGSRGISDLRTSLLDALAELLARLHLAGFFWGDCSLSNTLFRRDAGALSAYLVDAETGEMHATLTGGQREHDLAIAEENMIGELLDVAAEGRLPPDLDPDATAAALRASYESLWSELTREDVFARDERYRIDERLHRLNELGFDVEEFELVGHDDEHYRLRLHPHVVEPGHHRRRLLMLTGLHTQENQARRLLNDLASFRAAIERDNEGRPLPESVVAYRWLSQVFEPAVAAVPPELWEKIEPAELFHEILEHRGKLSEQCQRDVPLEEATRSYLEDVLRHVRDERTLLPAAREPEPDDEAAPEA
jgi:Domain of unknown function (DUF4032)/Lipopolysaccharide kinase (Kdo/WaaP) family